MIEPLASVGPSRRRLAPETRREAILDAAQALFDQKGWDAVTVADILDASGLSKGGFYHHFAAKEDVLEALVGRMTRAVVAAAKATRDAAEGNALARLNAFVAGSGRWKAQNAGQMRVAAEVMARPGNDLLFARLRVEAERAVRPVLREMIEAGIAEGTFDVPDADMAAELILALGEGRRVALAKAMAAARDDIATATETMMGRMRAEARACDRLLGLPKCSVVMAEQRAIEAMLVGMTGTAVEREGDDG
ncbi:TetR/AcrR family transcriptional regulator [Jannaschia sp. 2305UL9-9]|uniref:TetR/AcrR family transcriptional regulator n=1 Tax=Jannaschia sp. 2305UL9-9 TaxID=3121638 RepID=UPI0035280879